MRCSKCGTESTSGRKFCPDCGRPLTNRCTKCGAENSTTAKFCEDCGASLGGVSAASAKKSNDSPIRVAETRANENIEGERKTVTALFADIKGSTELQQDLDPEQARAIIDPALEIMINAARRYDGYVQNTGDGIFALFGAPAAHEDHPLRAIHAALRMQQEIRRYGDRLLQSGAVPIEIRVGVNTGEVVMRPLKTSDSHIEYAPIGHTTNLASRMQAVARSGSVVVSEATRKLVEGYFQLKAIGPMRVKGVNEPVQVYEVTGLGPLRTRLQRSAARGYTKFVGRRRELETMKHAGELAKTGHGQIVAAVAEAGVGKSRLLYEFKAKNQSGWMVLEALSFSHGKASAYLPVLDLLQSYFGIEPEDDSRKRREKVNGKVLTLDRALEDALPHLLGLLGLNEGDDPLAEMDAQIRQRRMVEALKRILLRESLNQPLMVIFEDLHWIDEETQAFLNLLADSIGTAKILLLVNYRPEYSHSWSSKSYYTQLRLDPLGKESAGEMLDALLGVNVQTIDSQLVALKRLIVEKTEGNPLFMEEIAQALTEEGALVRNGAVKLTRPLAALKVPPTVQDIIAARIDRLPENEKELLQTVAVIGREFPLALARSIINRPDDEIERILEHLQLAEFIYEQPAAGDIEYTFKHALTRDVAYNSVLVERRKVLHERIGAALESLYASTLDDHLAELAYHFAHSGNAGKAVEFCLLACQQCAERGLLKEAVAHFETGLEKLPSLPDENRRAEIELNLRSTVQYAFQASKGFASSESEEFTRRTVELSQRSGVDWEKAWLALYGLGAVLLTRGDPLGMRRTCAKLLAPAEERGSTPHMVGGLYFRAFASMNMGEFEWADKDFERAIALVESAPPARLEVRGLPLHYGRLQLVAVSAGNLWYLGYPDRALERVHRATAAARESGSKQAFEVAHNFASIAYHLLGDVDRLRDRAKATSDLAAESGNRFRRTASQILLGWTEVMANDFDSGIDRMRRNLAEFRASGAETRVAQFLAMIAAAVGKSGKPGEGLREIEESLAVIEGTGERFYEAEVHRLKGELLLVQVASKKAQAEQCFRTAIEISRKQRAQSWELRATTSLARLLRNQGRREEARSMLAEIYNWFTEGFDSADLKDAKTLLEELSA